MKDKKEVRREVRPWQLSFRGSELQRYKGRIKEQKSIERKNKKREKRKKKKEREKIKRGGSPPPDDLARCPKVIFIDHSCK